MPIIIERLPDEPIIVYTYSGNVTPEELRASWQQAKVLVREIDGPVYRISDVRQMALTFSEGMQLLVAMTADVPGSAKDARFVEVAITNDELKTMLTASLRQGQYGAVDVHICDDMEAALSYIRAQIGDGE